MVQRSLEGGVTLINSTVGIRRRFERALSQLQHQLQASESYSVQVYADINVHMANPELGEHAYTGAICLIERSLLLQNAMLSPSKPIASSQDVL